VSEIKILRRIFGTTKEEVEENYVIINFIICTFSLILEFRDGMGERCSTHAV
jgi:hypothetical protein